VINFRYHVVSMTAVFLALAIGLVLGTTALNGPAADNLSDQVRALSANNEQLRGDVKHAQDELNRQEEFVKQLAPTVLTGKLTGRQVLVITAAGAGTGDVDKVLEMLEGAGAKVTQRIQLTDAFFEPANSDRLLDTADKSQGTITGLPSNGNGAEKSAALLATVLLGRTGVPAETAKAVLSSYNQLRFITVSGDFTRAADATVFIAGKPFTDREAAKKNDAVVTAVEQFRKGAPEVVAAQGVTGDGNLVAKLRSDPALSKQVSTVDNVTSAQGQLVTALALVEQLVGRTGHYGIGAGANSLTPKAAA